jgi:uncharacterized protein
MISEKDWTKIRSVFGRGFSSCLHFAVASVNEDNSPHLAPIGALILRDTPSAFYFSEYAQNTSRNLERNPRICVMAVNAHRTFWANSLLRGKFAVPPGVRLLGTAGKLRKASDDEIAAWQKRVAPARCLKGHAILWSHMSQVHDLTFDSFEPVNIGQMTPGLW